MRIENLENVASTLNRDNLTEDAKLLLESVPEDSDTGFRLDELTRRAASAAMILRMVIDGLNADGIGTTEAVSALEGVSDILTDLDLMAG